MSFVDTIINEVAEMSKEELIALAKKAKAKSDKSGRLEIIHAKKKKCVNESDDTTKKPMSTGKKVAIGAGVAGTGVVAHDLGSTGRAVKSFDAGKGYDDGSSAFNPKNIVHGVKSIANKRVGLNKNGDQLEIRPPKEGINFNHVKSIGKAIHKTMTDNTNPDFADNIIEEIAFKKNRKIKSKLLKLPNDKKAQQTLSSKAHKIDYFGKQKKR